MKPTLRALVCAILAIITIAMLAAVYTSTSRIEHDVILVSPKDGVCWGPKREGEVTRIVVVLDNRSTERVPVVGVAEC